MVYTNDSRAARIKTDISRNKTLAERQLRRTATIVERIDVNQTRGARPRTGIMLAIIENCMHTISSERAFDATAFDLRSP